MRSLNIGDGHPGAGAGSVECRGKEEMLRTKDRLLGEMVSLFLEQPIEEA
jgi:hypothetical protein